MHEDDAQLIAAWCDWYEAGDASPGTVRLRRGHLVRLARKRRLLEACEADLVESMRALGGSSNYRKSFQSSLRSFYRWAQRTGLIESDPTMGLRRVAPATVLPKPISEVALAQALALAGPDTRLMILLGAYAGLRRAEIAAVHADDVTDLGLMVRGKGRKVRRVPIHPLLAAELHRVRGHAFPGRWPGGHVTPDYIADRLERVLPEPWTAHSLRHRFATQAYGACKDIRVVQQLLGHASIQTTVGYVLVDQDSLAAAVNAVA